ncbi:MAG: zinc ribbon domain-containing protein [Actinomycetia bacterium]|nr:zinc ribbon domain-containing protein [Actinomycetes bacterium]
MPTYQYRCAQCGTELEAVQKFSDPALTECPECEGALRKVYSAVGVVFKGSGFYATDNRAKSGARAAATDSGSTSSSSSSTAGSGSSSTSTGSGSDSSSSASAPAASA